MNNDKLVKLDASCNETGFVIKKYDNSSKVGAYIPSLMSDIDMKKGPWEQKVANVKPTVLKNDNNTFKFDPITICNYYNIDQRDDAKYYVVKELGEKIRIKYEDNDIKKAYFFDEDYKMTDSLMERIEEIEEVLDIRKEKFKIIESELSNKNDQIIDLQNQLNIKSNQINDLNTEINSLRQQLDHVLNLLSQIENK